ncbi:unnamed protein product [Mycena citricolor]|uniref:Uncharacterized protein n=1 Tax=Mycena citricolor TaxID=2018698 RepID=A0AAD2Q164_9AGAR|nr:unnamed protein product [Mycena citricolor]
MDPDFSSPAKYSSFNSISSGDSSDSSSDGWSDILGSDWRGLSDNSGSFGTGFSSIEEEDMLSLQTVLDFSDSSSELGWDSDSDWGLEAYDGDDETSSMESSAETGRLGTAVRNAVMEEIHNMYEHRYQQPRDRSALP